MTSPGFISRLSAPRRSRSRTQLPGRTITVSSFTLWYGGQRVAGVDVRILPTCGRSWPRQLVAHGFSTRVGSCCDIVGSPLPPGQESRGVTRAHTRHPAQPALQRFGHHHRAVLAAGAATRHRQVCLALAHVVRQGKAEEHARRSMKSLVACVAAHVAHHRRVAAVQRRSRSTKWGLGRQRTSNARSASSAALLEAEAEQRDHHLRALARRLRDIRMKMSRSSWTVSRDVVHRHVGHRPDRGQLSRSSRSRRPRTARGASGCGRRVSLNRRTSELWLASRKISAAGCAGCCAGP